MNTERHDSFQTCADRTDEPTRIHEAALVQAARDIVAGRSSAAPSIAHLHVLLTWLDGSEPTIDPSESDVVGADS